MNNTLLTQRCFVEGLFDLQNSELNIISSPSANERLDIYRSTIFENLSNALKITFPGVWKLIGDDCATSVAKAFCRNRFNLPNSGCLDDFGEVFPSFLATLDELRTVPYLADYAKYEWMKHVACNAEMVTTIACAELSTIQNDNLQDIGLILTPCCQLFVSNFSISEIEEVVDDHVKNTINLSCKGVYGVILYQDDKLLTFWIDKGLWLFIKSLQNGVSLYESAEQALFIDEEFDLTRGMIFMLSNKLIHKIMNYGDDYHE